MNAAALQRIKSALLHELDATIQHEFHQRLSEVLTDLRVHHLDVSASNEPDDLFRAIRVSRVLYLSNKDEFLRLRRALDRIATGSYGKCARCGRTIPARNLEEHPTTVECKSCAIINKGMRRYQS